MRLFIATPVTLPFYSLIKNDLSRYIDGKWVEGWNLHITHKFIGEDEPERYKIDLKIPNEKIKIKGIGLFSNKVLYLKADSLNIKKVNEQINNKFNLKKDDFIPHITLCRIKEIKNKKSFFENIKKWENKEYEVTFDVYLYKSTLTKKGPIYEKIYKYKSSSS